MMHICRSGCPLPDNGGWFSRESEEMFEELYKSSLSPFLYFFKVATVPFYFCPLLLL